MPDARNLTAAAAAAEQAKATSAVAAIALAQHTTVLTGIAKLDAALEQVRLDVLRIETQTKITNGRVTVLERWQSEAKGIAQGVGGTGRLVFYMLSAAAGTGATIVAGIALALRLLGH